MHWIGDILAENTKLVGIRDIAILELKDRGLITD